MNTLPQAVHNLIEALSQLPGIGPKTASRLAFYLLRSPDETTQTLAQNHQPAYAKSVFISPRQTGRSVKFAQIPSGMDA
jgi:recombinational DNA repair protein RecR